jgi:hypothetical protein
MNEFRSRLFGPAGDDGRQLLGTKQSRGADAGAGLPSVEVPRQEGRTKNTRNGDRHVLSSGTIELTHGGTTYRVRLINLSGGGAMVEGGDFKPKLWQPVDLHLAEGVRIECAVRWIKASRIGLEFAHETQIDCEPEERYAVLRAALDHTFPEASAQPPQPDQAPATEPDQGSENRAHPRHPLIWSGKLHYDFETTRVRLRNISAHGTLLDCSKRLPLGAEPLLDLGEAGSFFGTVSWANGNQVGLKFHEPFDVTRLARSKPQVAAANWVKPDYLNGTADSSPWEEGWERLTLGQLSKELDGFLKR